MKSDGYPYTDFARLGAGVVYSAPQATQKSRDRSVSVVIPQNPSKSYIHPPMKSSRSMTFTPEVWEGVLRLLKSEVPEFAYKTWLEPVRPNPVEEAGAPASLLCPSQFHCTIMF